MSTFKLEFSTDDAAFADDPDTDNGLVSGNAVAEVLRDIAEQVKETTFGPGQTGRTVRDKYGNGGPIGQWIFTKDDD